MSQQSPLVTSSPVHRLAWLALAAVSLVAVACAGARTCGPIPLSPDAATAMPEMRDGTGLPLVAPWTCDSRLRVDRVFEDAIPEQGELKPRVNFMVSRDGEQAFIFSRTPALLPFTRIPQSAHRLQASAAGITADGFAGPAGTGQEIAYLRWRRDEVTFELSATLRPWLTEQDVRMLAETLISRPGAK